MRKILSALVAIALALPLAASAETWNNVALIDKGCGAKFAGKLDEHPTECLKKCAGKGALGVMTSDGTWLKLDEAGNKKAVAAVNATQKKDHVRVNVTGDKEGDTIKVASLKLVE